MKKISGYILIVSVAIILFSCATIKKAIHPSARVYPLGDSSVVKDGSLIYALPLTVFKITVDFEKVIAKPGPYSKYALEMLGLNNVITSESESWSVAGIRTETTEELDPSEYFVIESNSSVLLNALKLKRCGLIMDINPSLYRKDIGLSMPYESKRPLPEFSDMGSDEYFVSQSDTVYKTVKLDTSFIKIPYLVDKKKQLSQEQLAEKAAKALLELRDGKHSILSGEANVFPQSSAAIDEINRMEKEYTALFTGKTVTERKTITYTYIPQRETALKAVTIFKLSPTGGILPASSGSGLAVVAELEPAKKTRDITIIPRTAIETAQGPISDKLYYRVPDVATFRIKLDNQVLFETRKLVYQLGEILQLPANYIIGN